MFLNDIVAPLTVKEAKKLSARDRWTAASDTREKQHASREAKQAKLPADKRMSAAIDALEKQVGNNQSVKEDDWHSEEVGNDFSSGNTPHGGEDPFTTPGATEYHEGIQSTIYHNGDQVELAPEYADKPGEVYTVSQSDQERGRCWIGDADGRGWYAKFDQLIPAETMGDDDYDREEAMDEHIGKVKDGYRLYSHKGKNLGTFPSRFGAEKHEREVQYFKHAKEGVAEAGPNAPYTPSPAKPFRNPRGFNKQGTGVGNKLADLNRKEWEEKKKKEQGVAEDTGSWIVYDPETKQIKKRFKTHTAGKSYAQTHGLGFASSEYYFDQVKEKTVAESTNYWTKLQNERNTKLNSLVNELKEITK